MNSNLQSINLKRPETKNFNGYVRNSVTISIRASCEFNSKEILPICDDAVVSCKIYTIILKLVFICRQTLIKSCHRLILKVSEIFVIDVCKRLNVSIIECVKDFYNKNHF